MRLHVLPEEGATVAVEALGFDDFENGVLVVVRHFMVNWDQPERQTWQPALGISVERWGPDIGLPVAYTVLKLVNALRPVRSDFAFCDPQCLEARAQVTADEAQLMRMLHHMRRDQTPDARDAVEVLTRGQMDPQVIRCGLALAARFGAGAPARAVRPTLHVVS